MPDGGVYHGADKVWSFYRRWFGSWEGIEIAPQRFIDVDEERVLVLLEFRGTGRESAIEVSMATGDLYTLRNGRIMQATATPTSARPSTPWGCGSRRSTASAFGAAS
jgi:SnoaL-like domain